MAYTLTQARPLLNAAELELFDQSRAEPIKGLTPKGLAGKVTRARTLRDKYRDLYRRQTVAVRSEDAAGRPADGSDNERTQRKADIFQEVLERFEARSALLQERSAREGARSSKTAASTQSAPPATQKTTKPAPAKAPRARSGTSAQTAQSASGSTSDSAVAASATSAGVSARPRRQAGTAPARSDKAPSRKAPTADGKAQAPHINAPLDSVPAAQRASPLKQDPGNIAIHAHQSSSARRTQGKRDSR